MRRSMGVPVVVIFIRAAAIRGKIQNMTEEKSKKIPGNFVVCDIQEDYAECLFRILTEHFPGNYQFHLFRDIDKMLEFTEQSGAEILLVSEEYQDRIDEISRVGKRFILTELPDAEKREGSLFPVFRYQSADSIIKEIRAGIGEPGKNSRSRDGPSAHTAQKTRTVRGMTGDTKTPVLRETSVYHTRGLRGLIGIYSPVHRIGKTRYALRLGKKIAEQVPVLYLNLEGYSGGDFYFPQESGQDMGDLLYCLKQERSDHGLKISTMAGQSAGMDYIRPMKNELDLRAVSGKEWMELLELISEKCIYETVILDLGDCIDGLYDILRMCDRVCMPYISDGAALAKIRQFEENMREAGYEEILRHTVKKQMSKKRRMPDKDGG